MRVMSACRRNATHHIQLMCADGELKVQSAVDLQSRFLHSDRVPHDILSCGGLHHCTYTVEHLTYTYTTTMVNVAYVLHRHYY